MSDTPIPTPSKSPSRALRRALALVLLPAIIVLGGCSTTIHRTVTRDELVPAPDLAVESVHLRDGRLVTFTPYGAVLPGGGHIGGTTTDGASMRMPLDSIAEVEISYREPSVARWAIVVSSIVGAGALFVAAIAVPK